MPNTYTDYHFELINQIGNTLNDYPGLENYQSEDDLGYLRNAEAYMNNAEEGQEAPATFISQNAPVLAAGSGMTLRVPDLTRPELDVTPKMLNFTEAVIDGILENKRVVTKDPQLKAYLGFAKVLFDRAKGSPEEALAPYSDPATNAAVAIFGAFSKLPSPEKMEELKKENPKAYAAGKLLFDYLNACADFYALEPQLPLGKNAIKEEEARKQALLKKMQTLQNAARALDETGREQVAAFLKATGNDANEANFNFQTFASSHSSFGAIAGQMERQQELLKQGVTLEESRLLLEFSLRMSQVKSDLDGAGRSMDQMEEPYRTQLKDLYRLSKACKDKFEKGFDSKEEKEQLFRELGAKAQAYQQSAAAFAPKDPDKLSEEELAAYDTASSYVMKMKGLTDLPTSVLGRAVRIKDRLEALEEIHKWDKRIIVGSYYTMMKDTKTGYLGEKDSAERASYKELMDSLKTMTTLGPRNRRLGDGQKKLLADAYLDVSAKAEAYLSTVLQDEENLAQIKTSPKRFAATRERVFGTLGVLSQTDPEKAEKLRAKSVALIDREISWNEIREHARIRKESQPSYDRYFKLHTGENAAAMTGKKLVEYTAKAAASAYFLDEADTKFDVSVPRDHAKLFLNSPNFKAAVKAAGPEVLRQVLVSGDPKKIVQLVYGNKERYALSENSRQKLVELASAMNTDGRSKEWKNLKKTLENKTASGSKEVFDAIEGYVKGKKAISKDPQRQESVKLALDALAIVAENGDNVAKARAQILVDRFNKVRDAKPGQPGYIDLRDYGKAPQKQAGPVPLEM